MMILMTLIKKEFLELYKTKKFLILPIIILLFSITSPLFAKFSPEIIKAMVADINFEIPEPKMTDAYLQLLSNLNQLVYFVILFLGTSIFISDKTQGRLVLLLSKPLNRSSILISKFINLMIQLIVSLLIGSLFFIVYTQILFEEFDYILYAQILGLYILYGVFLISLTMFTSTISKSYMVSITISIFIFFGFGALNFFKFDLFFASPGKATFIEQQILSGQFSLSTTKNIVLLIVNIISNLFFSAGLILASIFIFKNQEID